ncbi:MAG: AmmeMemoRadiSam system protein B [archaeon]|nr:AmmeMemoRadiSam system protein B [archaeon]
MRVPAVSGTFYPAEESVLREQIRQCFANGPGEPVMGIGKRSVSAVVVPHAGYVYSGTCAAYSYKALAENGHPDAYIVIGPDHVGVPFEFVMSSEDYVTPLGVCPVHQGIAARLRELIPDDPMAHMREHSIEVQIPFIQYIDPQAKIIPIIMGRQDMLAAERLARALQTACEGFNVVVIASSDLEHYVPKAVAEHADAHFLNTVASGDVSSMYDELRMNSLSVCGYGPIATAMIFSGPSKAQILNQTDSFESARLDSGSVVGYGSVVFTKTH